MKVNEKGRSMIEMLGVLALIGVLTIAGFWGYQKAIVKSKVNKTIEVASYALQRYADFTTKHLRGVDISGEGAMEDAMTIGLIDTCELLESEADSSYDICEVPLGEMFIKLQDMGHNKYSYMMFIMLIGQKPGVCTSFLTQGWDRIIPEQWQNNAKIWIKSESTEETVYPEGFEGVTPTDIGAACERACGKGNDHCMIVFDIASFGGRI